MRNHSSGARKTNDRNDLKETLYTFLTIVCPSDGKPVSAHVDARGATATCWSVAKADTRLARGEYHIVARVHPFGFAKSFLDWDGHNVR